MTEALPTISRLAAEFPPATAEQWLKLVDGVLKGAPFDKKLVAKTYDGLAIEPLYARNAGRAARRGPRAGQRLARSCSASIIPIRRPPTRRRCTTSRTARPG